ncbi:MAG: ferrous iron transport protein A [Candidatus Thiodiazotropha endolucinida]|uniref:FeoA domain protein n=2 Tax=Candidatus Thiodiazotropha TaxID=1913444 RepID=A0A7Z1AEZ5_9GAMM|nr:ferrous iron transport protein A [Candidatus Thiodiazotropha endolucinida]MCG7875696.1 ferrous iron transport protein A [Candidatus Thiodiazotropha taylori]MCG7862794.1 ferrous iron transport protein A [Candidatus Thiodiazotropha endolucinida]MCG7881000.1 ferrous iron transport protein A [Candidatus Thiodiazotropha taylori]MCG7885961.1 ferrous iron transport protein A [Candidatus Thiodiazotropha taylori]MCG7888770.1 ferrous iron transport protein A [Candidatus Thiodiazotropha taylori]
MVPDSTISEELISLARLPIGRRAKIKRIMGGRHLVHRLLSLGLRMGSEIELIQRRGAGVVVANQGARVALGAGVAEKLLMLPLEQHEDRP